MGHAREDRGRRAAGVSRRRRWRPWVLAGLVVPLLAWPPVYFGDAVSGRVVDTETGEPVEDVLVIAHWQMAPFMSMDAGGDPVQIAVKETLTNSDGRFHFPAWGPRLHFPSLLRGVEGTQAPALWVYKWGYEFEYRPTASQSYFAWRLESSWDGRTIELRRRDDTERRVVALDSLAGKVASRLLNFWCQGRYVPTGLSVIARQSAHIRTMEPAMQMAGMTLEELQAAQNLSNSLCPPLAWFIEDSK